ncbi:MAG: glycosyltransferase [Fimbriimonadales bacterium]
MSKLAVAHCVHDDSYYLADSIESFKPAGPVFVFLSRTPWSGPTGDHKKAAVVARKAGAEVILGDWASELEHRLAAITTIRERGFSHVLIPDGDEIIEPGLLSTLEEIARHDLADRVYVEWDTYWKSPEYVIRPREGFTPAILLSTSAATPVGKRDFVGGRPLKLSSEYGIIHHLSYVGPDERIKRKISTFSHKNEVLPGWLSGVWEAWDRNKLLRDLHPTHPPAYSFAEHIAVPEILASAFAKYRSYSSVGEPELPHLEQGVPTISVVIPVCDGADELRTCLDSLTSSSDIINEIIVVDNGSSDDSSTVARSFEKVILVCNDENLGFARACNQGLAASDGEIVVFLNSDTLVPRVGLIRLIESLIASGSIGAAGPLTNCAGHSQMLASTYTTLGTMGLFAEDLAMRDAEDSETDMLVGFCLAVKRSVLEEVGPFDERFGLGLFEDNDLCYRIRRAGYRLVIANKSFVHHHGSSTINKIIEDPAELLRRNERAFRRKWADDLTCGYSSGLSGLSPAPITFNRENDPQVRLGRLKPLIKQADISLCMIVRNEERILGDALSTAKPFFTELIVVDTGSTDKTIEVARKHGAKVFEFPWTDSFAEARNESLRHVRGKWFFWMDADDTLPLESGEQIVRAAANAAKNISAFVVPVQFIEESGQAGTRVDHVKLVRNLPGLKFEGRIHEQILPSLGSHKGSVARCSAVVLHSNYDASAEGQKKKRERDFHLLALEEAERPDHPFVQFNLGMTYHFTDQHEKAIGHFRRSIDLSEEAESHLRKAYALLGVSLKVIGRRDEAMEAFKRGLEVCGPDAELLFQVGLLQADAGRFHDAIKSYEEIFRLQDEDSHYSSIDVGIGNYKTMHNLGVAYMAIGNYEKARSAWLQAMEAAPMHVPSAVSLSQAALERGDSKTFRQSLDMVVRLEGQSATWAELQARFWERELGPEAATDLLATSLGKQAAEPGTHLVLARRFLAEGREREASPLLNNLNGLGVAEAAYCLGVIRIRGGRLQEALAFMRRALELNPGHVETAEQIDNLTNALAAEE